MKLFFAAAVFLVLSFTALSQSYIPVIELNKYWDQSNEDGYAPCSFSPYRYEFIEGDSVINGFSYRLSKAIQLSGVQGPGTMICPPFVADTNFNLFACLREDTVARKVYIYDENSHPTDQLLYDFTLNIGDTLKSDYAGQGTVLILDTIETLTLNNGETRKKYVFNEDDISYIEGIGGSKGLFLPLYMQESPGTTLYCVKKNGEDLFGTICNTVFVGVNEQRMDIMPLVLYPNPAESLLILEFLRLTKAAMVTISNTDAQILIRLPVTREKEMIDLSGLSKGIYFLRYENEQITEVRKIIKE